MDWIRPESAYNHKEPDMSKIIVALVTSLFAASALATTPPATDKGAAPAAEKSAAPAAEKKMKKEMKKEKKAEEAAQAAPAPATK